MLLRHFSLPFVLVFSIATGACGGTDPKPGKSGPSDLAGFATPQLDFATAPVDMAMQPDDLAMAAEVLCSAAISVSDGTKLTLQDTSVATETLDGLCVSGGDGQVLFYKATIPATYTLTVAVNPEVAFDPIVRIIDICSATTCLGSADLGYEGANEMLSFQNTTTASRDVIIAVGGTAFGQGGTFDLDVKITPPPPPAVNAMCANAIAVGANESLMNQDLAGASQLLSTVCLASAKTGVLFYSTVIPPNSQLDLTVTPSGFDPVIRLLSACGAASCLASADSGNSNTAEQLSRVNSTASPVPLIIAVGGYGANNTGTFTLALATTALPAVPPNVSCNMPTALASGVTLSDQSLNGASTTLSNKCVSIGTGPSTFYSATVPAGQHLIALATPTSASWDVILRLLGTCNDTTCLGSADNADTGAAEALGYRNASAAPVPVVLAVGNYSATTLHSFDLTAYVAPLATNATCAQAIPLSDGTMRLAEDGEGATTAITSTCLSSAGGKVLYYSATVPAGKTLKVRVTPIGHWDPVIRLLADCAATSCTQSVDGGNAGAMENLTYVNSTAAAQSFVIAVGGYATTTKPFHIEAGIF